MLCKNCYGECDQYYGPRKWCRDCYFEEPKEEPKTEQKTTCLLCDNKTDEPSGLCKDCLKLITRLYVQPDTTLTARAIVNQAIMNLVERYTREVLVK